MKENQYIDPYFLSKKEHIELVKTRTANFMESQLGGSGRSDYFKVRDNNITEKHSFSNMIPWVLGDLCGIEAQKCVGIASSWEAIVLYARQLDSIQDKDELTNTDKNLILSASILFAHGLDQLKELLGPNSSSSLLPLYEAAKYQKLDMYLAKNINEGNTELQHLEVMRGKNIFAKIINKFYVDNSDIELENINNFLDCLATFAQIIDDIKDLEDDIYTSSYSHLICSLDKEGIKASEYNSAIQALIQTGILKSSIELAISYLDRSISISKNVLQKKPSSLHINNEMPNYLMRQKENVEQLLNLIISIEESEFISTSSYKEVTNMTKTLWMGS